MTRERNLVYKDARSYWGDTVKKAPAARSYLNYGLTYLNEDVDEALKWFQKTVEAAPNWVFSHVNLGIAYERKGNREYALWHYNRAVELDRVDSLALRYRGDFHQRNGATEQAIQDWREALPRTIDTCRLQGKIGAALDMLGRSDEAALARQGC